MRFMDYRNSRPYILLYEPGMGDLEGEGRG